MCVCTYTVNVLSPVMCNDNKVKSNLIRVLSFFCFNENIQSFSSSLQHYNSPVTTAYIEYLTPTLLFREHSRWSLYIGLKRESFISAFQGRITDARILLPAIEDRSPLTSCCYSRSINKRLCALQRKPSALALGVGRKYGRQQVT